MLYWTCGVEQGTTLCHLSATDTVAQDAADTAFVIFKLG